jgi:hypothetical protein
MGRQYLDPHTPSSTPSSDQPITLANVQQGNALLYVVAAYFAPANGQPVLPIDPTDSNGAWTKGVQDKASVPLHTQIYYELNANAGTHTITPGPAGFFGDGRLWVIEVSGISSPVTSGSAFTSGTAIPSQSVSTAAAVGVGDFVIAVGTEDGNPGSANPQFSVANGAWMSIGSEQDGINCVAIEARYSIATSATVQTVQWSWPGDTTAATSAASIIAFKPAH